MSNSSIDPDATLKAIRQGIALRPTKTVDKSAPVLLVEGESLKVITTAPADVSPCIPPPPPLPPMTSSGPPPAPPPPPMPITNGLAKSASTRSFSVPCNSMPPDRNQLLSEIQQGTKLRKTLVNDRSQPMVDVKSNSNQTVVSPNCTATISIKTESNNLLGGVIGELQARNLNRSHSPKKDTSPVPSQSGLSVSSSVKSTPLILSPVSSVKSRHELPSPSPIPDRISPVNQQTNESIKSPIHRPNSIKFEEYSPHTTNGLFTRPSISEPISIEEPTKTNEPEKSGQLSPRTMAYRRMSPACTLPEKRITTTSSGDNQRPAAYCDLSPSPFHSSASSNSQTSSDHHNSASKSPAKSPEVRSSFKPIPTLLVSSTNSPTSSSSSTTTPISNRDQRDRIQRNWMATVAEPNSPVTTKFESLNVKKVNSPTTPTSNGGESMQVRNTVTPKVNKNSNIGLQFLSKAQKEQQHKEERLQRLKEPKLFPQSINKEVPVVISPKRPIPTSTTTDSSRVRKLSEVKADNPFLHNSIPRSTHCSRERETKTEEINDGIDEKKTLSGIVQRAKQQLTTTKCNPAHNEVSGTRSPAPISATSLRSKSVPRINTLGKQWEINGNKWTNSDKDSTSSGCSSSSSALHSPTGGINANNSSSNDQDNNINHIKQSESSKHSSVKKEGSSILSMSGSYVPPRVLPDVSKLTDKYESRHQSSDSHPFGANSDESTAGNKKFEQSADYATLMRNRKRVGQAKKSFDFNDFTNMDMSELRQNYRFEIDIHTPGSVIQIQRRSNV